MLAPACAARLEGCALLRFDDHEILGIDAEGATEADHPVDRELAVAFLQFVDLRGARAGSLGERLHGKSGALTEGANPVGQRFDHGWLVSRMLLPQWLCFILTA